MGPLLKTGGLFQQTRAGMYDGDTPELIERTLRGKLRERSIDRPQYELHRIWQQYDKDFDRRVDINEFRQVRVSLFLSLSLTVFMLAMTRSTEFKTSRFILVLIL